MDNTGISAQIDFTPLPGSLVAYVSNSGDNTVSVLSLESLRVVDTILVGNSPRAMVLTPDGSRLYAANLLSENVSVIDTLSATVIGTIPVGKSPCALAVSRNGQRVYVANEESDSLSVINTASHLIETTVQTLVSPTSLAFHPQREELWVGFGDHSDVLVLSAGNYIQLASLTSTTGRIYGSGGLTFVPDGTEVFGTETCGCCGRFHRISGSHSNGGIPVLQEDLFYGGGWAVGVAVHPSGSPAYFAQQGHCATPPAPRISELGGANRTLALSEAPQALAVTPEGDRLCIVGTTSVRLVDTTTLDTIADVGVGIAPKAIAIGRINRGPTLSVRVASVQLCWNTIGNAKYQVEYKSEVAGDVWHSLGDPVAGDGTTTCITASALETPKRLYRVRLVE
ncbi:MAG TPA: beta-propeller fold lactonase family protein [Verrucomicrobiota bacterium]|nr:beta-propeller fold lactonase family protein [Verrucomicrobiota bacterium]